MGEIQSIDDNIVNFFNSFEIEYCHKIEKQLSTVELSRQEKIHYFNPINVYARLRKVHGLEPKQEVIDFTTMYEVLFRGQIYGK